MKRLATAIALCAISIASATAQPSGKQAAIALDPSAGSGWTIVKRTVTRVVENGKTITRFDEHPDAGLAWSSAVQFGDGDIDVDVKGRDVAQKSFVGVAFHMANDTTAEIIYLRPFNFRGADSAHHAHAVQYTAYPEFSWQKLREEHSGMYESAVPESVKPEAWVHLRVSVHGNDVRVYLDHAAEPVLSVKALGKNPRGGIGLWVGDQSNGDFANFTITPAGTGGGSGGNQPAVGKPQVLPAARTLPCSRTTARASSSAC
jgi:hypothetical protein